MVQFKSTISTYLCANDNFTLYDADKVYCEDSNKIANAYRHLVMYSNTLWKCQWWTQGHIPGAVDSGVWKSVKECNETKPNLDDICWKYINDFEKPYTIYNETTEYCRWGRQYVKYDNAIYMCRYSTLGDIPDQSDEYGAWLLKKNCMDQFSTTDFFTTD